MTISQLLNAFKIIKKHDLVLRMDLILGAPYETIDMMEESFKLAKESGGDRIFFAKLYPFPGTEIKNVCEKEQMIDKDFKFNERGMPPVDRTKFTTEKQLTDFTKKISFWQGKRYINEGFKLRGIAFIWDIIVFLIYYKIRYDLEYNQIYRWNVQRYKYNILNKSFIK